MFVCFYMFTVSDDLIVDAVEVEEQVDLIFESLFWGAVVAGVALNVTDFHIFGFLLMPHSAFIGRCPPLRQMLTISYASLGVVDVFDCEVRCSMRSSSFTIWFSG